MKIAVLMTKKGSKLIDVIIDPSNASYKDGVNGKYQLTGPINEKAIKILIMDISDNEYKIKTVSDIKVKDPETRKFKKVVKKLETLIRKKIKNKEYEKI